MRNNLVNQIKSRIAAIKSENVKSISQGQLDLLVNTNASTRALEDFLEDVTFVVKYQ